MKFKNNLKNLYTLLNNSNKDTSENNKENELAEENEIDENKYFPEEIDELIEERIKDKYFKNLAKFLITSKLKKKKKRNSSINNNNHFNLNDEFDNSFDENNYEENEENEDDEENNNNKDENFEEKFVTRNKNKNENFKKEEKIVKFDKESLKGFFVEFAYSLVEMSLTYFTVCLLLLFIFQLEQNVFITSAYYVLFVILLCRVN